MSVIFAFHAYSNDALDEPFAIGGIVTNGKVTDQFFGRLPNDAITAEWAKQRALPALLDLPVTRAHSARLLEDFAEFFEKYCMLHMVTWALHPTIGRLLLRMHDRNLVSPKSMVRPITDLRSILHQESMDTHLHQYADRYGIPTVIPGEPFNPLYDAAVIAAVCQEICLNV